MQCFRFIYGMVQAVEWLRKWRVKLYGIETPIWDSLSFLHCLQWTYKFFFHDPCILSDDYAEMHSGEGE